MAATRLLTFLLRYLDTYIELTFTVTRRPIGTTGRSRIVASDKTIHPDTTVMQRRNAEQAHHRAAVAPSPIVQYLAVVPVVVCDTVAVVFIAYDLAQWLWSML